MRSGTGCDWGGFRFPARLPMTYQCRLYRPIVGDSRNSPIGIAPWIMTRRIVMRNAYLTLDEVNENLATLMADGTTSPVTGQATLPRAPNLDVQLTATFDHEAYPRGNDPLAYFLVELFLMGDGEIAVQGVDADLALVLDVSGSMDKPNRYPLLREAVRQLLAGLGPTDRTSITLFSDRAETVVPLISGADAA